MGAQRQPDNSWFQVIQNAAGATAHRKLSNAGAQATKSHGKNIQLDKVDRNIKINIKPGPSMGFS